MSDVKLDLRGEPFPSGPGVLELMTSGYLLSSLLFTAVELGVFDELARQPSRAEPLAARIHASAEGTRRLLSALCAVGLCRRDADGLFHDSELSARALTTSAPDSIVPLVEQHRRQLFPLFARLTDGVRSGAPQLDAWRFAGVELARDCYAELARHPAEQELMTRALARGAVGMGRLIAQQVDLTRARSLVDLGGGGGQIALELAEALPELAITIVDLPDPCRHAQARVDGAGLSGRVRCVAADLRRPLEVGSADAVLLAGVISDFPPDERALVLRHAAAAVAPDGRLLVCETLFNPTRTGPAMPALLSLFMLLSTRGDNFTADELRRQLADVGFGAVEIHGNGLLGQRDLAVARRAR